jgi:ribosomal-protein-alanine N-acetyltransferase
MASPSPENTVSQTFAIHTPRLILRDFVIGDTVGIDTVRRDPVVVKYMDDAPRSVAETQTWIESAIHYNALIPRAHWNLAIVRRDDDAVIGWVGFGDSERYPGPGNFGVGYMLAAEMRGQGYATETLRAVIAYIFDLLDGSYVSAHCHTENIASARVMEKSGMHFIRTFNEDDSRVGSVVAHNEYGIRKNVIQ